MPSGKKNIYFRTSGPPRSLSVGLFLKPGELDQLDFSFDFENLLLELLPRHFDAVALHAYIVVLGLLHRLAPFPPSFVAHDTYPEGMLLVLPEFILRDAVKPRIHFRTKGLCRTSREPRARLTVTSAGTVFQT